jgi:signal transduction histidine kinase
MLLAMKRQRLMSQVLEAAEASRYRELEVISNLLHDETGGLLTAAGLKLEILRMDGVTGLEPAIDALERAFDSVRQLSRNVHPHLVERVGLSRAIETTALSHRRRFPGELNTSIANNVLGPPELHRIAEEALDNAVRHSKARTIEVVLTSQGELIVRDDGCGFDRRTDTNGLGLMRVRYLGAKAHLRVRLQTSSESGTIIRVTQLSTCHSTSY